MNLKRSIVVIGILVIVLQGVSTASAGINETAYYGRVENPIIDNRWISANQSALFNASENAYVLEYSEGVARYEEFTTYNEVDSAGDITKNSSRVSWDSMRRDASSYVYYDYGANNFTDFVFKYTVKISKVVASGSATSQALVQPVSVTNHITDMDKEGDGVGQSVLTVFMIENANNPDKFLWRLFQREDHSTQAEVIGTVVYDVGTYYFTFGRNGTNIYVKIYDDSARSNLLENLNSSTGSTTYDYRYIESPMGGGYTSDPADYTTGYIEDLTLGFGAPRYEPTGVIYSSDLLVNVTEYAQKFLVNYTLPANTLFSVKFSSDNLTWIGKQVFDDGLEYCLVDLDPFVLNPLFVKFTLNTTDTSKTPLIWNYEVLYTADCNGGITNLDAWSINWLMAIIWLVVMGIGVFKPDRIIRIFAGFFGLILGLLLMAENGMVSIALICLNLYLVYEGSK